MIALTKPSHGGPLIKQPSSVRSRLARLMTERITFSVLSGRLQEAIARINRQVPVEVREESIRCVLRTSPPSIVESHRRFQGLLVDDVAVEYREKGRSWHDKAWLAVNQFSITEDKHTRLPNVIAVMNGLLLVMLDLRKIRDEGGGLLPKNSSRCYESPLASFGKEDFP